MNVYEPTTRRALERADRAADRLRRRGHTAWVEVVEGGLIIEADSPPGLDWQPIVGDPVDAVSETMAHLLA